MSNEAPNKDVALKAWDIYQGLAKGMGESAWKIRSIYFAMSTAIIAYGFTSQASDLYILAPAISVLFLLLESGYRRLQNQYIAKSAEIEKTLNDFIANEPHPRFPDSIGTDVETPTLAQLRALFGFKRVIFWLPYLAIVALSLILWAFRITK